MRPRPRHQVIRRAGNPLAKVRNEDIRGGRGSGLRQDESHPRTRLGMATMLVHVRERLMRPRPCHMVIRRVGNPRARERTEDNRGGRGSRLRRDESHSHILLGTATMVGRPMALSSCRTVTF